jgi:hypothetical protein
MDLTAVYYRNCHYHFIIIFIFTDIQTHFGLFSHHHLMLLSALIFVVTFVSYIINSTKMF